MFATCCLSCFQYCLHCVSIPFRVLDVCNPRKSTCRFCYSCVSIPFRGFRCLQPVPVDRFMTSVILFQSLSGVLDVCNMNRDNMLAVAFNVSIPFRGFRCLQLVFIEACLILKDMAFQSLSGVLDVCNVVGVNCSVS